MSLELVTAALDLRRQSPNLEGAAMGVSRYPVHFLLAYFTALVLAIPSPSRDPQSELASVFTAWEHRRTDIRTVRYVAVGQKVFPKGCYNHESELPPDIKGDVPKEDYVAKTELSWLVDFRNNRVRRGERTESFLVEFARFIPHYIVQVYDGSDFWSFAPREENSNATHSAPEYQPEIYLGTRGSFPHMFLGYDHPLLFAHGIITEYPPDARSLRAPLERHRFRVHGQAVIDGRPCLVLRTEPWQERKGQFDEYWVDVLRGSAVLRWQRHRSGRIMHTLDTRHQEVAGQWLPREWTLVDYDWKGSIRISYTFRVTELEVNREIDPRQFERKLEQGRIVRDHKDDKLYRVASSGELAPLQFDLEKTPGHGRAFLAIIIFVLALGVSFFALREVRRRFQRQAWGQQRQSE